MNLMVGLFAMSAKPPRNHFEIVKVVFCLVLRVEICILSDIEV
jgi:hypothetical protein